MKITKEHIILVIIMVALALYLALNKTNKMNYHLPEVQAMKGKRISKLEIGKDGESIILNKKSHTWYIGSEGYPADTDRIDKMLDAIEKLTVTALVSESKNYVRYDLTDKNRIMVKAWEGNSLERNFDIGKAASTFQHTFIKLAEDPNVYQARGNIRTNFDQSVENLRDKTILAFEENEIREIHITKDKKPLIKLIRKQFPVEVKAGQKPDSRSLPSTNTEEIWQDQEDRKMDQDKINNFLSSLNQLKCEEYIGESKREDYMPPFYTVTLKGSKIYTVSIFKRADKTARSYPAVSSENGYPFLLGEGQVDKIMKELDRIMKTPDNS